MCDWFCCGGVNLIIAVIPLSLSHSLTPLCPSRYDITIDTTRRVGARVQVASAKWVLAARTRTHLASTVRRRWCPTRCVTWWGRAAAWAATRHWRKAATVTTTCQCQRPVPVGADRVRTRRLPAAVAVAAVRDYPASRPARARAGRARQALHRARWHRRPRLSSQTLTSLVNLKGKSSTINDDQTQ